MGKRKVMLVLAVLISVGISSQGLSYTVTPSFTDYSSSFGGSILIENTGSEAINNWVLEFDWDQTFSVWSATKETTGISHKVVNAGWNKTIPPGGSVSFGINGTGARTSQPAAYVLKEQTGGTVVDKPAKPSIRVAIDAFGKLEYTVEWNIYGGNGASKWELYEDDGAGFNKIHGPIDLASLSTPQTGSLKITDKSYGIYKYKVKVLNSKGETWSDEAFTSIGGASKLGISYGSVDVGRQAIQIAQPQGLKTYTLETADNPVPIYTVETNNSNILNVSVSGQTMTVEGLKAGRAGIKIVDTVTGDKRFLGIKVNNADGTSPELPEYLSIGSVGTNVDRDINFIQDFQAGDKNKFMDVRYVYLNGEPDSWDRNVDGWQKWGANIKGHRAYTFIRENMKLGIIPFFVYYTICGSNESYTTDLKNIQDEKHLGYYFKDLRFTLDMIKAESNGEIVGMIFEPDFIGYMMQMSKKQPNEIYANTKLVYEQSFGGVNAVGVLDSTVDVDPLTNQPFADNLYGLVSAINYIVNKYNTTQGTNIKYGWQFNLWSNPTQGIPVKGLMHKTTEVGIEAGRIFIQDRSRETAEYYINAGVLRFNPDFISIDKYGKDAASFAGDTNPAGDPANATWFWNADNWNNYLLYTKVLHQTTNKPVVLWQLPVGHIERSQASDPYDGPLFDPLTNTKNGAECSYEDSSTTFFFGDTFKPGSSARFNWFKTNNGNDPVVSNNGSDTVTWGSHFEAAKDSGIMMALFGAGVGEATHGNVSDISEATEPEDDKWFFVHTQRYLSNPVMLTPVVPDTEKPSVPLNVVLDTVTDNKATISWNPSTDNVAVANYIINLDNSNIGSSIGTSYTLEGLQPLTAYSVKVQAKDTSGNVSDLSQVLSFTTPDVVVDVENPTEPTGLVATTTDTTASLSWTESTDNVGVVSYNVYNGSNLIENTQSISIVVSGLTPLTLYSFYVEALDAAGNVSTQGSVSIETKPVSTVPEWSVGATYTSGNEVLYLGISYIALVTHTAHVADWNPKDTPTLWRVK